MKLPEFLNASLAPARAVRGRSRARRSDRRLVHVEPEPRAGAATLDDVARRAGVGVATAYRHFESKSALIAALFESRVGRILARAEAQ